MRLPLELDNLHDLRRFLDAQEVAEFCVKLNLELTEEARPENPHSPLLQRIFFCGQQTALRLAGAIRECATFFVGHLTRSTAHKIFVSCAGIASRNHRS